MHVTVIAKAPVPGSVKTRLCPPCTAEQAAGVAAAALAETLVAVDGVARRTGARRVLLLDGERQQWMPADFAVVAQRGGGLGERLCNGFADLGPGVIIGMETPAVAAALVDGIEAVERGIDVLGLATDGGYWMIGLASVSVALGTQVFNEVPMSSSNTALIQLRRLHSLGRSVRLLRMARDLDTYDDLLAAAERNEGQLAAAAKLVIASLG